MFGKDFDIIVTIILVILAVVFFMGKGGPVLRAFGTKGEQNKRTAEEEKAYQRMIGIFLLPLAIGEAICAFVQSPIAGIIMIVISVADLIIFGLMMRRR